MRRLTYFIITAIAIIAIASCSKEERFTTDPGCRLTFSDTELKFDTVFSTIGSSTKRFVVYNNNSNGLRITDVSLKSRGASGFRLNLDGQFGTTFSDLELLGNDSLFCFVEVTVNPHDSDNPVLIDDQVVFTLESGNQQTVSLQAYGQDVIILRNEIISTDRTFTSNRPYLIYDSLVIKQGVNLDIEAGATLCFHNDGHIICYGTINADGTLDKPITFRGDRLDRILPYLPYDRLDCQWIGIMLKEQSHYNLFNYVDIHSGQCGIYAFDKNHDDLKMELTNSVIHNISGNGLQMINCLAQISNTQISNCENRCVDLCGGFYRFNFCTIAQFYPWSAEHGVAFQFTNAYSNDNGETVKSPLDELSLTNCLITGTSDDEVKGNYVEMDDAPAFEFLFTNCMLNTVVTPGYESRFVNCHIESTDPRSNFVTLDDHNFIYDFRLTPGSSARGKGADIDYILMDYPTDRRGIQRNPDRIDVGCYQGE